MFKGLNHSKISGSDNTFREACIFGKQKRKQFNESDTRAKQPYDLIHFDICGPMSIPSLGGNTFFVIFVDDYSGFIIVRPMKKRLEILDAVESVIAIANSCGHKIKCFRSDNARKFISKDIQRIMNKNGIVHEFSTPYAPQQNGRAERQIRTIVETGETMLAARNLPKSLWAEVVRTAAIIRNRIPLDRLNNKTPWEIFTGKQPNIDFLRIYGSNAYAHIEDKFRNKFDKKSKKLVLVGYEPKSKAYLFFY